MSLNYAIEHRVFHFKRPSGTSRGVLTLKHSWFITLWENDNPSIKGIGECSIIEGLSPDFTDAASYETAIHAFCKNISLDTPFAPELMDFPSILFGIETALLDLQHGGQGIIFDNSFTKGKHSIPINGLIWMGEISFMENQIEEKIAAGFTTLKLKIGAIDTAKELDLLAAIRSRYSSDEICLRVDANGAFSPEEASELLLQLSTLEIHSIEQPIKPGNWNAMQELCASSPIPIALDEELIGVSQREQKMELLTTIRPPFIILKPSLHGGICGTKEWIELAENYNIAWWMTSALESNIGLNAICQLAAEYDNKLPQGLGTGSLYTDNIASPLRVDQGTIRRL
jgi:o-succinylbenzoate synthase